MKLNIVQAVKLGTVACLLAVTTQTVGNSADSAAIKSGDEGILNVHCNSKGEAHIETPEVFDHNKRYKLKADKTCDVNEPAGVATVVSAADETGCGPSARELGKPCESIYYIGEGRDGPCSNYYYLKYDHKNPTTVARYACVAAMSPMACIDYETNLETTCLCVTGPLCSTTAIGR